MAKDESEKVLAVSDRLKWALTRKKVTPNAPSLVRLTGINPSSARAYLNGSRGVSFEAAQLMWRGLDVNPLWLLTGDGDRIASPDALEALDAKPFNPLQDQIRRRMLTVYSASLAGPDGEIELAAERSHLAPCPTNLEHVEKAYGTTVGGSSMLERFRDGETVFANPNAPVVKGDDVVVQIFSSGSEGTIYGLVKRFVSFVADELVLEQLNPPKIIRYPRSRVKGVHKITDWSAR